MLFWDSFCSSNNIFPLFNGEKLFLLNILFELYIFFISFFLFTRKLLLNCFDRIITHIMLERRIFLRLVRIHRKFFTTNCIRRRLDCICLHFLWLPSPTIYRKNKQRSRFGFFIGHIDSLDLFFFGILKRIEIQMSTSFI
jgi:hypothetical protein